MLANLAKSTLAKLAQGDHRSFEELYSRFSQPLYRYVYATLKNHDESKEIIQTIFVKIWDKRSELVGVESLQAYIYAIARNTLYNHLKSKYHQCVMLQGDPVEPVKQEPPCDTNLIESDLFRELNVLLEKLPERRREIFMLNRFYGMTYREIAEKLDISENTVDTQIRRTLSYLREELDTKLLLVLSLFLLS